MDGSKPEAVVTMLVDAVEGRKAAEGKIGLAEAVGDSRCDEKWEDDCREGS